VKLDLMKKQNCVNNYLVQKLLARVDKEKERTSQQQKGYLDFD